MIVEFLDGDETESTPVASWDVADRRLVVNCLRQFGTLAHIQIFTKEGFEYIPRHAIKRIVVTEEELKLLSASVEEKKDSSSPSSSAG
jgi:hypothetical protein